MIETVHRVELADETDWDGFRRHARALLAQDVAPEQVEWRIAGARQDLLGEAVGAGDTGDTGDAFDAGGAGGEEAAQPLAARTAAPVALPRALLELCERAALNRDPQRHALLYRFLWRVRATPAIRHDPLDPDRMRIHGLAREVHHAMHKMKAFVRFRPIERAGEATLHVAWFEPPHHVVRATAPFFVRRFSAMHWAILTPDVSVHWDGKALRFAPGAAREDAPDADAGEALWLTYYRNIFNPARLKVAMMKREMAPKYWPNLPEAALIGELVAQATTRSGQMLAAEPTVPKRRIVPLRIERDGIVAPCGGGASAQAWAGAGAGAGTSANAGAGADAAAGAGAREGSQEAGVIADAAGELERLGKWVQHCRDCPIGEHATQAVWGEGPVGAPLMLVGEQPGDREDLQGRAFVGPAGQLLDKALADLGWPRDALYLTNAVKHFKFELRGKRRIHKTAGQREAEACLTWLEREIALVRPQGLVALGATAARAVMGAPVAVQQARGRWMTNADGMRVLVTWHPSALLRAPEPERAWMYRQWLDDLRLAGTLLAGAAHPA
jgi:DNA polymerase